eukprot:704814-Prymnesium_polylepis.1
MACESDSAQAANQRMMQSDAAQLMWRRCRDVVPERAASDPMSAGCEPAALNLSVQQRPASGFGQPEPHSRPQYTQWECTL